MRERNVGKGIDGTYVRPEVTAFDQCTQLIQLAAVLSREDEVITRDIGTYRYVNVSARRRSVESPRFWRSAWIRMHPLERQ